MASTEPEVVKSLPAELEAAPPPPIIEETAEKLVVEPEAPPPETKTKAEEVGGGTPPPPKNYFPVADVVLRVLLFAASLVAVVVMGTSKQTELLPVPVPPFPLAPFVAKFNQSPALIYFIAAFSVLGFYSLITALLSVYAILKPSISTKLLSHFVIFDVLVLGIAASATGSAGAVGYVGYKGQSHAGWKEICDTFDVFCKHVAGSIALALFGSVVSTLLVLLSIYSLSKKIPK